MKWLLMQLKIIILQCNIADSLYCVITLDLAYTNVKIQVKCKYLYRLGMFTYNLK